MLERYDFRIIVIDDNVDAADTFCALLESCGYQVRLAYGAEEGLRIAASFEPHAIFCDLGMPNMDGFAFAPALRAQTKSLIPLLVTVTGWSDAATRSRTQAAGYDHHLVKPAKAEDIIIILEQQRELISSSRHSGQRY